MAHFLQTPKYTAKLFSPQKELLPSPEGFTGGNNLNTMNRPLEINIENHKEGSLQMNEAKLCCPSYLSLAIGLHNAAAVFVRSRLI
jgi:hypothetical protein